MKSTKVETPESVIEVVRIETPEALQEAFNIRHEVFVVGQNVSKEEEYDAFEETSHHFLATKHGQPCGTARWRVTEKGIKLERFAVLASFRGIGVGNALLKAVLAHVKAHPDLRHQRIYLNAQLSAMFLYAKHGFVPIGDHFMECDIEHQQMELSLNHK